MFTKILAGGLIGGIVGGILVAAIQTVTTTPLILHAEVYENAANAEATEKAPADATAPADHDAMAVEEHHHAAPAGEEEGSSRLILASIATIGAATGYAWIVLAAMFLKGETITARRVIPWAIAGFFATGLVPALGLAPELPGAAPIDLVARQLWWLGTAVAAAAGMASIWFGRGVVWTGLGIVLFVAPFIIGAPEAAGFVSQAPAELASEFSARSLVVQALIWIIPAAIAGLVLAKWNGSDRQVAA
ncbi:MAG: CbtA family protein [Parvibaculaceae bacterium]|nr:CbtA family protein [Parvibaculaceae bacterium]